MHNSLFIRDRLLASRGDPIYMERKDPHYRVALDPEATLGTGDMALQGAWVVNTQGLEDALGIGVAMDQADFWRRMGVKVVLSGANANGEMRFGIVPKDTTGNGTGRGFTVRVAPGKVEVLGEGNAGLWAGIAWVEQAAQDRRGAFLPLGEHQREAAWGVTVNQGPWGENYSVPDFSTEYLSEDALRLYAHMGVNSMMIYGDMLCYTDEAVFPEIAHRDADKHWEILSAAAGRAKRYGVGFSWVVVGPKLGEGHALFKAHPGAKGTGINIGEGYVHCLCTNDTKVRAFYRDFFEKAGKRVPELDSVILIVAGESMYHCRMWRQSLSKRKQCPVCGAKSTEEVIADLTGVVKAGLEAGGAKTRVCAWAYTTNGWENPDRVELIKALPEGVDVFHHIDKDHDYEKGTYRKDCWDYSLDFTGIADAMKPVARAVGETGHRLWVKTEMGVGLEAFTVPYVPCMQHLAEKWESVKSLSPVGVHQSWLFWGMCNTRAESLAYWAAYEKGESADAFLDRLAKRDFGPGGAEAVKAWGLMGQAVKHLPVMMVNYYYIGPTWLGPAHPVPFTLGFKYSSVFDGYLYYLQEHGETFSQRHIDQARVGLVIETLNPIGGLPRVPAGESRSPARVMVDEYRLAADYSGQALGVLKAARGQVKLAADIARLEEETDLVEALHRTWEATANICGFILARDAGDTAEMRRLALAEKANALAALGVYERSRWLDFSVRLDGKFSGAAEMIREKVRLIEEWV